MRGDIAMVSEAASGIQILVNTYTTGAQFRPSVAALDDGGWVVTWESDTQDGSGYGIYQQRYAADGDLVGDEVLVNAHTTGHQQYSSIIGLADGGWVVTWQSDGQDGSDFGIYQQRFKVDGSLDGGETLVNTYTTDTQLQSSVTALSDGGWLVSWTSNGQDGSAFGVYQQRYAANGDAAGDEILVNTYSTADQGGSVTTALVDGGWVVTWVSYNQDGDNTPGIYQQRYDNAGGAVGGEARVNSFTTGVQDNPTVTALTDGGWVVSWDSDGQDGSATSIYQQRYDAEGAAVGNEARVNSFTTGAQNTASVTGLTDGGWVVTWTSKDQDGSSYGVYQQHYDADGTAAGDETLVNAFTTGFQLAPSVTAVADGGWVVAWQSQGEDGDGYGVFQRYFDGSGDPVNNPPTDISLSDTTVNENVKEGAVIGGISGTDPDAGDHLRFSLVKNPDNAFAIDNGNLVVAQGAKINFEVRDSYMIRIRATDDGGLHLDASFTIAVSDLVDLVKGTAEAETLVGASGMDIVKAFGGNDTLEGGKGIDKLYGGKGRDTFLFSTGDSGKTHATADTIYDFTRADSIDLTSWDANSKKTGVQHFDFVGADAFSGHPGELRFVKAKSDTWIEGNTDSDKKAEFVIHLDDALAIKAEYFDL
jgi:hypothetical protein